MTNMSCKLYFCMSADHIFVSYCMSNMDIVGFVHVCVAHPCVLRLHILVESYNICTPVVHWFSPLHCDLEVPRSNPTHVCDGFFFF